MYKDVGLTPYYLGKEYNLDIKLVYSNRERNNIPKKFRNVSLIELPYRKVCNMIQKFDKYKIFENLNFYKYLIKNAKKIDYLMLFHLNYDKLFFILLYKLLNKKGKVYLKSDINFQRANKLTKYNFLKKPKYNLILRRIDLFSCEIKKVFKLFEENKICGINLKSKLLYMPNGFDEEYLLENTIKVKLFEEKENIMITVGRIGTKEKNNEMLLTALDKIDLKNWRIYIIGPYTDEFKRKYDEFIENNQDKKGNIILSGDIEDKNLLYHYYNRAKTFILTSRHESFGIVLSEALRFGDYIITTDVGAARDITDNDKIGKVIDIDNSEQLREEILKVISEEIDLKDKYKKSLELSEKQFLWNNIVKNEMLKEFFTNER